MKISVITSTFNSAATVSDTFESILRQTYKDVECIVVDGASRDGTVDIIREYEPRFGGRMLWVSERDNGLYDAMNKGIHMATGDIIGILNSDDFYTSRDVLETIVKVFESDGVDAVYGDIHFVAPDDLSTCKRYYSSSIFKRSLMKMGFMPAHPSFYCKRELYLQHGLFDTSFRIAADFEQLLRLIYINGIKTKYIAKDCVTMRTGGVSTSGFSSHKRILKEHMAAYKKNGIRSTYLHEAVRYAYKITEVIISKLNYRNK